jgi:hypothetical protein
MFLFRRSSVRLFSLSRIDRSVQKDPSKKTNFADFLTMSSAQPTREQTLKDEQLYSEEEQSRRERISKSAEAEEKQQFMKRMRVFLGASIALGASTFVWMGMPKDDLDQLENESFMEGYYRRAQRSMKGWFEVRKDIGLIPVDCF